MFHPFQFLEKVGVVLLCISLIIGNGEPTITTFHPRLKFQEMEFVAPFTTSMPSEALNSLASSESLNEYIPAAAFLNNERITAVYNLELSAPQFDFTFEEETSKEFPENFLCVTTGSYRRSTDHQVGGVDPLLFNICVGNACQQILRSYFVKSPRLSFIRFHPSTVLVFRLFIDCDFTEHPVQNTPAFRWILDVSVRQSNIELLLPEVSDITKEWEATLNIVNDPNPVSQYIVTPISFACTLGTPRIF
ncbi:hypothetical protein HMI56_004407 [Coelomomyces lativittatus]|nr:hypothetical protein HMI56_004407 [Coelomomyces lativittatus]